MIRLLCNTLIDIQFYKNLIMVTRKSTVKANFNGD